MFNGLVVVVPTRNRSDLAMNAVNSVRGGRPPTVRVVVSDNSTDAAEADRLKRFCDELEDDAVRYMRPPAPLAMTAHWDWAMREVLRSCNESHIVYLTDRMLFRSGELARVADIACKHPDDVVCYTFDRILDHSTPLVIEQRPWTGKLFRVESASVLRQFSLARLDPPGQPKMLNCVVPRAFLLAMRTRYGNVFSSVAPDFSFCFRTLAAVDSVLYYDSAAIVHYASARSNGASLNRGIRTKDHADFVANLAASSMTAEAPAPEIETVGNVIFHEYVHASRETASPRFLEVDRDAYLDYLAHEVAQMENAAVRCAMSERLAAHGWTEPAEQPAPSFGTRLRRSRKIDLPWVAVRRVGGVLADALTAPWSRPVWTWLANHLSVAVPRRARFHFASQRAALDYAQRYRSRPVRDLGHLESAGLRLHELQS